MNLEDCKCSSIQGFQNIATQGWRGQLQDRTGATHTYRGRVARFCCFEEDLLFGDVVAFEADASQWQIMRDDDRTMAQPWIPEQIVRLALVRSGVVIAREPVAYCKVSSRGSCRYFGQLSRSLELMGSELLRKYPEAALLLCAGACGPCGNKSAPRLTLQTPEDRARDSNWCQMIDQVRQAGVCQHGWGCQLHRQHRRY